MHRVLVTIERLLIFKRNKNNTTRLIAKHGHLIYVTRKNQLSNEHYSVYSGAKRVCFP